MSNSQTPGDDPDYSVALGTHGIARKLQIDQSITDGTGLNAEYQNRVYRLAQLEKLKVGRMDFPVFSYKQAPSLPLNKTNREAPW